MSIQLLKVWTLKTFKAHFWKSFASTKNINKILILSLLLLATCKQQLKCWSLNIWRTVKILAKHFHSFLNNFFTNQRILRTESQIFLINKLFFLTILTILTQFSSQFLHKSLLEPADKKKFEKLPLSYHIVADFVVRSTHINYRNRLTAFKHVVDFLCSRRHHFCFFFTFDFCWNFNLMRFLNCCFLVLARFYTLRSSNNRLVSTSYKSQLRCYAENNKIYIYFIFIFSF